MQKAIEIANHLKTRYKSKGHGGYNIFEDDKVEVWYDTYFPNVSVYVKINGEREQVYSKSGHGIVSIYKPGRWEQYLDSLIPRVQAAEAEEDAAREAKKKAEYNRNFGGIDDSKVFG